MSTEKQLNIHKALMIVSLSTSLQSFCAKLILPGPSSVGSLIFLMREDVTDTTDFEKSSSSGIKCITNMFSFKTYGTKKSQFSLSSDYFLFPKKKTKGIMSVPNMTESPVFSLALGRISQSVMVKIVTRFLGLLEGMNYRGITE